MKNRWARWAAYIAVAIAFAVACVWLSHWQFDRNTERAAKNAVIEQNYDAKPVTLEELLAKGEVTKQDEWKPVRVSGHYDTTAQLLARNRPHGGTSAFEVLTPLRLSDGTVVVIDRGWVPPGEGPEPDAVPTPPSEEVTVIGRVRLSEPLPPSGRGAPEGQVPTINVPLIAQSSGPTTLRSFYLLRQSENPAAEVTPHDLVAPTTDPGPHLSYAVQWILFAVMGFAFIFYMIRTELKHRDEDPASRRMRRRDRDSIEEDALLDGE